jgi:hypothetical protein
MAGAVLAGLSLPHLRASGKTLANEPVGPKNLQLHTQERKRLASADQNEYNIFEES